MTAIAAYQEYLREFETSYRPPVAPNFEDKWDKGHGGKGNGGKGNKEKEQ